MEKYPARLGVTQVVLGMMEKAAFAISVMFKTREICIGYFILVLLF
jgi:hypothetical protein